MISDGKYETHSVKIKITCAKIYFQTSGPSFLRYCKCLGLGFKLFSMRFDSNDITAKNKDNIDQQAKIKNR